MMRAWMLVLLLLSACSQQGTEPSQSWSGLHAHEVVQISLQKAASEKIELILQNREWMLSDASKAQQDAVHHLLDDLEAMQSGRVVTQKRSHDAELGLQNAVHVLCQDASGKVLLDLEVGKQGSDLISTYVRRAGEDEVVAVNRSLVWQVQRRLSAWRDKAPKAAEAKALPKVVSEGDF